MKSKSILILKQLEPKMITKDYIGWLNDSQTMMFTEQRFKKHTFSEVKKFVSSIKKSKTEFLYAIFISDKSRKIHIGNIKLGPINYYHKYAFISYFIGNKNYLNKGYGKLLIKNIVKLAKNKFKLRKVLAGAYSNNMPSAKVLEFNKFKLEGKIRKQFKFRNKYVDHLIYGKLL